MRDNKCKKQDVEALETSEQRGGWRLEGMAKGLGGERRWEQELQGREGESDSEIARVSVRYVLAAVPYLRYPPAEHNLRPSFCRPERDNVVKKNTEKKCTST